MKQDKNLLCTTPQSALQEEILIENTHTKKEQEKPCPYHRQNQRKRWQEGEHCDHNRNVPISAEPVCATGAC